MRQHCRAAQTAQDIVRDQKDLADSTDLVTLDLINRYIALTGSNINKWDNEIAQEGGSIEPGNVYKGQADGNRDGNGGSKE